MNDDPTALLTAQGQELLSRLASEAPGPEGASLALAVRLRRDYPASLVATAMLFVRNPTGVSHSPQEHASLGDCESAVTALAAVLDQLTR